jgi:hypothetical protein
MELLAPAQQLEVFRLFCKDGKTVHRTRKTRDRESQEGVEEKREACQELYEALILTSLAPDAIDVARKDLPGSLIKSLGSFVAEQGEEVVTTRRLLTIKC